MTPTTKERARATREHTKVLHEGTQTFRPYYPSSAVSMSFTGMMNALLPFRRAWKLLYQEYISKPNIAPYGFKLEVTVKATTTYQVYLEDYDAIC